MALRKGLKRRRWGWRRIHKWIGVSGGTVLVVWIVSGIFISIPAGGRAVLQSEATPPDYTTVRISPADAVAALESRGTSLQGVRSVQLQLLGSRPAYLIQVAPGGPALVDAVTGIPFEVDAREALRIVREIYDGPGTPAEPVLVEARELRYFQGELPAYRIGLDDDYGTEIYVAVRSGTVMWWDGKSRARRWMAAVHDLWPIGPVLGARPRVVAMVGGGLLALAITLTGYYLAWRRGGWRPPRRRPAP